MKFVSVIVFSTLSLQLSAQDLLVAKVCPVLMGEQQVGIMALSMPWYHSGRENAAYVASDNATGIGIEIHYFNNKLGEQIREKGRCDRFRLLQVRESNALLDIGELAVQIDVPDTFISPFYDQLPLEHGYGTHLTPADDKDKPWIGQVSRASTVALYDTPYISDAYGKEGQNIEIKFETCLVCQNDNQADSLLSCAHWGYQREYMGGMTGWAEPEPLSNHCSVKPSEQFLTALEEDTGHDYFYWFSWR